MKIRIVSIPVLNQEAALHFYTTTLGFIKKLDIPLGGDNRWLTVVSAEEPDGPEILLEPSPLHFEPAKNYQNALFEAGIPYTQLHVSDIQAEFDRLVGAGIEFKMPPTDIGSAKIAVFNDTCGNFIQLVEVL